MKKPKKPKLDLKSLIRPLFTSTILFGYATKEQVETQLNAMFPNKKEIIK